MPSCCSCPYSEHLRVDLLPETSWPVRGLLCSKGGRSDIFAVVPNIFLGWNHGVHSVVPNMCNACCWGNASLGAGTPAIGGEWTPPLAWRLSPRADSWSLRKQIHQQQSIKAKNKTQDNRALLDSYTGCARITRLHGHGVLTSLRAHPPPPVNVRVLSPNKTYANATQRQI